MCIFDAYFIQSFLIILHIQKNMIQYIPYRWVEFVQIYLNRHTIPVKLNKTWKQVKERKGEKK